MNEKIEEEILTEARRSIDFQMASVDELRSRSGLLLAAASVSISVLGTTAASHRKGLDVWASPRSAHLYWP